MKQALSGIKVLDLTQYIAGPYCTKMLADFGAEVIKIERPGTGDGARRIGPFPGDIPHPEKSGQFLYLNTNKLGITLNLKTASGADIFRRLVKESDIVVEGFRPGVMERLGFNYKSLEKLNKGLVMTSVSNFGQAGPYRDYKTSNIIMWGMGGARHTEGKPGERPIQPGGWLTHYVGGIFSFIGTAVALFHRNQTGVGQYVDTSMLESVLLTTAYPTMSYSFGQEGKRGLAGRIGILPCQDGYIGVNFLLMPQWERLCHFFGLDYLAKDPRFQSIRDVGESLDEVKALVAPKVLPYKKEELFYTAVEKARIPFGLVPSTKDLLECPQYKARGFFQEVDYPAVGKIPVAGAPFKMTETPWAAVRGAPLLGQHNEEIYCQRLGYSREDLVLFREHGII